MCGSRRDVHIHTGDSNKYLVEEVLPKIQYNKYTRALCLLDPYALHLDWAVILQAGQSKAGHIKLQGGSPRAAKNFARADAPLPALNLQIQQSDVTIIRMSLEAPSSLSLPVTEPAPTTTVSFCWPCSVPCAPNAYPVDLDLGNGNRLILINSLKGHYDVKTNSQRSQGNIGEQQLNWLRNNLPRYQQDRAAGAKIAMAMHHSPLNQAPTSNSRMPRISCL